MKRAAGRLIDLEVCKALAGEGGNARRDANKVIPDQRGLSEPDCLTRRRQRGSVGGGESRPGWRSWPERRRRRQPRSPPLRLLPSSANRPPPPRAPSKALVQHVAQVQRLCTHSRSPARPPPLPSSSHELVRFRRPYGSQPPRRPSQVRPGGALRSSRQGGHRMALRWRLHH